MSDKLQLVENLDKLKFVGQHERREQTLSPFIFCDLIVFAANSRAND